MTTFVLVHGAFEGGWIWSRVRELLVDAGHRGYTPTLTGCGERYHLLDREVSLETHVEDVLGVLTWKRLHDVHLVGHSYGWTVVTQVADRAPDRIAELVYLDASAPQSGQSSTGAFTEGTDEVLTEMSGDDWLLPPLPLEAVGITAPDDVAWVEPLRRAHPVRTLHEPVELTGAGSYRRRYVRHTPNEAMVKLFGADPLQPFVERARAEGWIYREIAAGHDAMVTHPQEVVDALTGPPA